MMSASVNLMTCQTCKFWELRYGQLDEGICARIFHDSLLDSRPDAAYLMIFVPEYETVPGVGLVTKGNFGCTLHEEKTKQ